MGNPAVLISNGPSTSKYPDEMKAAVLAYRATRGLSSRQIKAQLQHDYGYSASIDTICDWLNDPHADAVMRNQTSHLVTRTGALIDLALDQLADIAHKPDILKYLWHLNGIRGTGMDKLIATANVNVNLSVDVQLNQVIANMGEADLERFISRGTQ